jgi:putative tricarboxylic transport membrane protein
MKRANLAAVIGLLLLTVFIYFESRKLSFGTFRVPHTGFYPKILTGLLFLLALVCLVQTLRDRMIERPHGEIPAESWFRIGVTLATLIGFALVLEWLGFLLSTFLLMILLLRAIEAPHWSRVIVVALVTAALSYGLFGWLFGVPLPAGVLGI